MAILRSVSTGACADGVGTEGGSEGWKDTDIGVLLRDLAALRASFSARSASNSRSSSALSLLDCLDSTGLLDAESAMASSGSSLLRGRPGPLLGAILQTIKVKQLGAKFASYLLLLSYYMKHVKQNLTKINSYAPGDHSKTLLNFLSSSF